jgi:hypothetical protein
VLGALSALLILAGVLSPLDLPTIDLANFAGYVLWSVWLLAFAVLIIRSTPALDGERQDGDEASRRQHEVGAIEAS